MGGKIEMDRLTPEEKQELKGLLMKFVRETVNGTHSERSIAVEVLPSVAKILLEQF